MFELSVLYSETLTILYLERTTTRKKTNQTQQQQNYSADIITAEQCYLRLSKVYE